MSSTTADRAREIAACALRLRPGAERDAYLAAAAGDDAALGAEIGRLVALEATATGSREALAAADGLCPAREYSRRERRTAR